MRFRGTALLLAATSISWVVPAHAATAVKPGNSCTKVGAVKKTSTLTLVCTKSGKKLVWVKKQVPVIPPVISPTPTPTPVTEIVRYNGPKTAAGRAAAQPIYSVLNQVAAEMYQKSLNSKKANVAILSDDPNNSLVAVVRATITRTIEMMRVVAPDLPDNEIYLYRSMDWLEGSSLKSSCPHVIENQKRYGWANAGCVKYWVGDLAQYENPQWYIGKDRHSPRTLLGFTGSHETVHLIQLGALTGEHWRFPSWYREGSATVGAGLSMVSLPDYANGDYSNIDDWENNSWSKQRCQAAFEMWKVKTEAEGHELTNSCEYSVGRRMIEYLVARDKTFENIRKVFEAVGPNMTFNEAFAKYHGIELSAFFAEVEAWLEKLEWDKAMHY